ncbi:unnamed protein product [Rotaria sordida]|uniref:Uncharacterized protein n=1 Tax=Rotaria sordida TaxID=392033 RepID=A0A819S4L0_9BILA|nr:unnamed protein product [Rotaria sordida]
MDSSKYDKEHMHLELTWTSKQIFCSILNTMSMKTKFELLANEELIECFQYLNAPDMIQSFDRLNYRFYALIRNIPLKSSFNEFCQTMLLNPEIKQNIIFLQLSNKGTRDQIQSFFSSFSLNELIHLRSLLLIDLKEENIEQLLSILPLLSNLYCFYFTSLEYKTMEIITSLLKLKIRILIVPQFDFNSKAICETMSITSLAIYNCDLSDLWEIFKYRPTSVA